MPTLSIMVAARNGHKYLKTLLNKLSADFEVFVVNDNSDQPLLLSARQQEKAVVLLNTGMPGKKHALEHGVQQASTNYILFTDVDCRPRRGWAHVTQNYLANHPDTDLLLQPVAILSGKSFFGKLQSMEFATIMAFTLYTAKLGKPVMCNGANLCCRRERYLEFIRHRKDLHISSGDDMFLLEYALANGWRVGYHFNHQSAIDTLPVQSLAAFWHQRLRWAGKWKHYKSTAVRLQALSAGLLHLVIICACIAIPFASPFTRQSIIYFLMLKAATETLLIYITCIRLKQPLYLLETLLLQLIYSPYVVAVGLVSTFKRK